MFIYRNDLSFVYPTGTRKELTKKTVRALTLQTYGGPESLRTSIGAAPTAGPGQVLVSVRAAGVNGLASWLALLPRTSWPGHRQANVACGSS